MKIKIEAKASLRDSRNPQVPPPGHTSREDPKSKCCVYYHSLGSLAAASKQWPTLFWNKILH